MPILHVCLCLSLFSLVTCHTSVLPIYILNTFCHVNSRSTIHFNTCVCWLEIRVWPMSWYWYILLHYINHYLGYLMHKADSIYVVSSNYSYLIIIIYKQLFLPNNSNLLIISFIYLNNLLSNFIIQVLWFY